MKIGIITFSFSNNFGAVLQCFALQEVLRGLGADVEVVNYNPSGKPLPAWQGWGLRTHGVKGLFRRFVDLTCGARMRLKFDRFRSDRLMLTTECRTYEDVSNEISRFDALIVGSDQVWNLNLSPGSTEELARVYFLDFPDFSGRRISYAACCGQVDQPGRFFELAKNSVRGFDAVSVRNEMSLKVVKSMGVSDAVIVCDPVMLCPFDVKLPDMKMPFEKYILFYGLSDVNNVSHRDVVRRIRHLAGDIPVVAVIPSAHKIEIPGWVDSRVWCASPLEWVSLIKNASFVYTDSFHGAVFSLKYEVRFLAYYAENWRSGRLRDFAVRYHLEKSVFDLKEISLVEKTDLRDAQQEAGLHREMSLNFLRSALAGDPE